MTYFPGTTLACLIATSCHRLDRCPTLFCLSPKATHTLCILIDLQHLHEKLFPPIHIPKELLKNSSCGYDTANNGPNPYIKYSRWKNISDAIGLMYLSTMATPDLPHALSTMVSNNVYELSMIKPFGGVSFPTLSFLLPVEMLWYQINPCC